MDHGYNAVSVSMHDFPERTNKDIISKMSRSIHVDQMTSSRVGQPSKTMAFNALKSAKKHLREIKTKDRWTRVSQSIHNEPGFLEKCKTEGKKNHEDEETLLRSSLSFVKQDEEEDWKSFLIKDLVFGKALNILLLFVPVCIWAHHNNVSDAYIFTFSFLAMIPLASTLGDFTEELALSTNEVVGGLLNATFGNAVEIVVGIQALLMDEIRVLQCSMLGSIFSNLLLVLGCCFFFGGISHKTQEFNGVNATANLSLLSLTSIAFVLPVSFASATDYDNPDALSISRVSSLFLILMYTSLLVFQLYTHSDLLVDEGNEKPNLPFNVAIIGLVVVTLTVTYISDILVVSIDGFVDQTGVSKTFVGMVILPIIGNAVEHITAVTVAMKGKMDLAISVAVGSSVQISLFALPFTVLMGWIVDKPMTLNYPIMETTLLVLSMIIVSISTKNDESNWLYGFLLINTYCMIGVFFWHEVPALEL